MENGASPTKGIGVTDHPWAKKKTKQKQETLNLISYTKANSKQIMDLNVRRTTIRLLGKNNNRKPLRSRARQKGELSPKKVSWTSSKFETSAEQKMPLK